MENAVNVEILETRFQRAGEGRHVAKSVPEARHRPSARGPRPRRAARPSALCAGIRCKRRGRAAEPRWRPRSPALLLRDLRRPGRGRGGAGRGRTSDT